MNAELLKRDKETIRDVNQLNSYFKEIGQQLYHKEIVSRLEKEGFTIESDNLDDLILVNGVIPVFLPSMFADSIFIYHPVDWEKNEKWETEYTDWQLKIMKSVLPYRQQMLEDLTTDKFKTVEDLVAEMKTFFQEHPLITKKLTNLHKSGVFERIKSFKDF